MTLIFTALPFSSPLILSSWLGVIMKKTEVGEPPVVNSNDVKGPSYSKYLKIDELLALAFDVPLEPIKVVLEHTEGQMI